MGKRAGRRTHLRRFSGPRSHVSRQGQRIAARCLNAQERAEIEARLRSEGRLGPEPVQQGEQRE